MAPTLPGSWTPSRARYRLPVRAGGGCREGMAARKRAPWGASMGLTEAIRSLPLIGTALRRDTLDVGKTALDRGVFLIGSEGRGLSPEALARCGATVRIPMEDRCESLNAAAAAAVVLWEGYRSL